MKHIGGIGPVGPVSGLLYGGGNNYGRDAVTLRK